MSLRVRPADFADVSATRCLPAGQSREGSNESEAIILDLVLALEGQLGREARQGSAMSPFVVVRFDGERKIPFGLRRSARPAHFDRWALKRAPCQIQSPESPENSSKGSLPGKKQKRGEENRKTGGEKGGEGGGQGEGKKKKKGTLLSSRTRTRNGGRGKTKEKKKKRGKGGKDKPGGGGGGKKLKSKRRVAAMDLDKRNASESHRSMPPRASFRSTQPKKDLRLLPIEGTTPRAASDEASLSELSLTKNG